MLVYHMTHYIIVHMYPHSPRASSRKDKMDISHSIVEAAKNLGYHPLKEEQQLCIEKFVEGYDVFG